MSSSLSKFNGLGGGGGERDRGLCVEPGNMMYFFFHKIIPCLTLSAQWNPGCAGPTLHSPRTRRYRRMTKGPSQTLGETLEGRSPREGLKGSEGLKRLPPRLPLYKALSLGEESTQIPPQGRSGLVEILRCEATAAERTWPLPRPQSDARTCAR